MSCQIKLFANIIDLDNVRRHLFPWDDDRGSDSWLYNCLVSISPTAEVIAFANNNRILVLSAKWDSNAVLSHYHISYTGSLANDVITSILCLPIASQSQSSQLGPDWTCIIIGLQTGQVKFFTEDFSLLLMEYFHDEPVKSIKCQSHQYSHADLGSDLRPEELYFQYPKCVCVLPGTQLFPVLRQCRNQLARNQAKGANLDPSSHMLLPKKWGLCDQFEVNDVSVVGLDVSNTFNHLLNASICGGFNTKYRAMPPNNTLIVGAGSKPYVGFHYVLEGGMQPLLSDVAKAVANKLKSALPGWLVGNKSTPEKPPPQVIQPAEAAGFRYGLCDIRRIADTIIMSPNKKLSVVTDDLGRITLIDNFKGVTIRMWKGYRGAQCAFLQIPDEERNRQTNKSSTKRRQALFLIIYTPKKGTIEIWALQQGPRIVTFSASKFSKLIYTSYGLMGLGNNSSKSKHHNNINCFLLDPDGKIKEILIPFHFALTEKNSKRARDVHLYKRLKQFLKSEEFNHEKLLTEVSLIANELKTNEIRSQCYELLLNNKNNYPEAALIMAETFLEKLTSLDSSDSETTRLINLNKNLLLIVNFYIYIDDKYNKNNIDAENGNVVNNNVDNTRFVIADKEMNNLQKLLDLSTLNDARKLSESKVTFNDENKSIFCEYLSIFNLNDSKDQTIILKKEIPEDKLYRVSEKIFNSFILTNRKDLLIFKEEISKSNIRTLDLIKMLLNFWINRPLDLKINLEEEMQNLSKILYIICLTATENMYVEYNEISLFWTEIRDYLADSAKPFPALTAAMLCRSVAQRIEQEKEAQQSSSASLGEEDIWEKLSQENCQWTLLIGKLEDVSLLNIILLNKPLCENCALPKLYYDPTVISLKYILQKGKGAVSELVAQWLAKGGIDPEFIIINEMSNLPNDSEESTSRPESVDLTPHSELLQKKCLNINQPVFDHLNILKKQFPYSLESSAILANMCWEYALSWQKDIQNLSYLDAMLKCLQFISNYYIKQGLYYMVWTTHLKQTFESVCKLINKVGKVPKEILCRQDTGLTDIQISIFIEFCTNFLDNFMDVLQECYGCNKKPVLHFENLWENGGNPLTVLALQQTEINDALLYIHFQLSLVIQIISTFGIKQLKPVPSLFDSLTINLFFTDLSQNNIQINTYSSEPKLLRIRTQFLIKVINSSIETVRATDEGVYSTDHVNWMAKCVSLAGVWGIDTDLLRREQVLLLYTNGFNDLAEDILPAIGNTEALGDDLLKIAGKQLKKVLMASEDLMQKVVALSPALSQYLETLDKDWCAPGSLESIIHLAEHCVRYLPESNSSSRQASLLLDACITLQGLEKY